MDDLHRTINLDDPIRTNQVRMFVVRIERVLRGTGAEDVRRDAIAAIVAVLARAYADGVAPAAPVETSRVIASSKGSVGSLARKYFQR
jgi:hypothetical protein